MLDPPRLSAAWIAARSVQLPLLVETHDVPAGLLSAASVGLLTTNDVVALDGCEKASIPGTAIAAVIVSTAKSFEAVRRPHFVASVRLLGNDIRFPPMDASDVWTRRYAERNRGAVICIGVFAGYLNSPQDVPGGIPGARKGVELH